MTEVESCHQCLGDRRRGCSGFCPCPYDGNDIAYRRGYCAHPEKPLFGTGITPEGWASKPVDPTKFGKPLDSPVPPAAVPRLDWPLWSKALASFSTDADAGIGDTAKRCINVLPSHIVELFKEIKMFVMKTRSCGCDTQIGIWNAQYPLK